MNMTFIQPIVLVDMTKAVSSEITDIIGSFTTSSWEPQFLKDGNHMPENTFVLVSCCKDTQTPGNFLRILPTDRTERELVLASLGVEISPEYRDYPSLVLVKQARNSPDGTYSGKKVLTSFTTALRNALKVPKTKKKALGGANTIDDTYSPYMGSGPRRRRREDRMGL